MANDHRTVLLSILATLVAATIVFLATVVVSGGFALDLVRGYVLPLVISAFTLTVFWGILFAQQKGKLSWLVPVEPNKDDKAAKVRDGIIQVSRSDRSCLRDTTIHREFFWEPLHEFPDRLVHLVGNYLENDNDYGILCDAHRRYFRLSIPLLNRRHNVNSLAALTRTSSYSPSRSKNAFKFRAS